MKMLASDSCDVKVVQVAMMRMFGGGRDGEKEGQVTIMMMFARWQG